MHCMPGWRMVFCWLDNLVPHTRDGTDPDADWLGIRMPPPGLRWVCRLHDRMGFYGDDDE